MYFKFTQLSKYTDGAEQLAYNVHAFQRKATHVPRINGRNIIGIVIDYWGKILTTLTAAISNFFSFTLRCIAPVRGMKVKRSLYQTVLFCLFVISGEIKFVLTYYESPVDITLLMAILITFDMVRTILLTPHEIRLDTSKIFFLTALMLFYALFIASLAYTPSEYYAYKKTFFFLLTMMAFVYPLFMKELDVDLFAKIVLFTAIPAALWFIVAKYLYWSGRKDLITVDFDPLLGAYLGLSSCASFLAFYYASKNKYKTVLALLVLQLALGARGPFLFVIIVLGLLRFRNIYHSISNFSIRKVDKTSLFLLCLSMPLVLIFRNAIVAGFKFGLLRFSSLLSFDSDNSSNERLAYFDFAISKIFSNINSVLFGYGVGSFGLLFTGREARDIPHNIFMEAWFELGIFGVITLFVITVIPLFLKKKDDVIKMMAIFFLLDSLKSGGFDEMRFMFGIFGALIFIQYESSSTPLSNRQNSPSAPQPSP